MAQIAESFYLDANAKPITNLGLITKKTITFTGGTTNAWGDDGGTRDGGAIFTVTGLVKARVLGVCTTLLDGGATEEVGIAGGTAIFCAQITDTALDAGEIWLQDTTPATSFLIGAEEEAANENFPVYLLNGNDIILTTTTTNTTAGVVDFYCIWNPISSDGSVADSGL